MKTNLITPIIMAGGSGTRLWPLSRQAMPKQFCDLGFENTLFQESLLRMKNKMLFNDPVVVCSAKHEAIVHMQAEEVGIKLGKVICEPVGRNTTAAIALATTALDDPANALYLVSASDHKIHDIELFQADVIAARQTAMEEKSIVLFGVKPTSLETGYGYVRAGAKIGNTKSHEILEFIEKPPLSTVEILVQEANIFWNSGMFFFRKDVVETELNVLAPEIFEQVQRAVAKGTKVGDTIHPDEAAFVSVKDISFDFSVMEKTRRAAISPLSSSWSDLGSWKAVWENKAKDVNGNVLSGSVVDSYSKNCIVTSDGPVVGTCGLEDVVVVANRDAVLVCHKEMVQGVKNIVEEMKVEAPHTVRSHAGENRPWGDFQSLDHGDSHQVKRITVKPGGQLSLQYHYHRSEHWIVVKGTATVTVDDDVRQLTACQQIFIPQGAVHRLENFTDEPVEIIEVQYGSYLGEDDIVRVEDVYNRPATEATGPNAEVA